MYSHTTRSCYLEPWRWSNVIRAFWVITLPALAVVLIIVKATHPLNKRSCWKAVFWQRDLLQRHKWWGGIWNKELWTFLLSAQPMKGFCSPLRVFLESAEFCRSWNCSGWMWGWVDAWVVVLGGALTAHSAPPTTNVHHLWPTSATLPPQIWKKVNKLVGVECYPACCVLPGAELYASQVEVTMTA